MSWVVFKALDRLFGFEPIKRKKRKPLPPDRTPDLFRDLYRRTDALHERDMALLIRVQKIEHWIDKAKKEKP